MSKGKILFVDDNQELALAYRWLLEAEGYAVEVAPSGFKALELLESGVLPDLILIDYKMPRMDGKELFFEIRNRFGSFSEDRVFVLTSFPEAAPQLGILRAEGVPCAEKPADILELLPLVEKAMGAPRQSYECSPLTALPAKSYP